MIKPRLFLLFFFVVPPLFVGCGTGAVKTGEYTFPHPLDETYPGDQKIKLQETGYSIQAGAFSDMENAVRLAAMLAGRGVEAYYIRDRDRLFKVRFGNFTDKDKAMAKAEEMLSTGIINAYYIINPENSAAVLSRVNGVAYLRNEIVATAELFLGVPYQWGGTSLETGFDCSGFTMVVYQINGLILPRTSIEQYTAGTPVKRDGLAGGDLVFFDISGNKKSFHVGIFTKEGRFIHAPSEGKKIRYGSLSNPYFSRRFVGARTYL